MQLLGGMFFLSVLCSESIRACIYLAKRKTNEEAEISQLVNDTRYTE